MYWFDKFFKYKRIFILDHTVALYNVEFKKNLKCVYTIDDLDLKKPYLYIDHKDKQPEETFVIIDLNTLIWKAYFPTEKRNSPYITCCGKFMYKGSNIVPIWSSSSDSKIMRSIGVVGIGFLLLIQKTRLFKK